MLQDLLAEIRAGGSLETHALAERMGTTPLLVEAMLGHLQRLGLIDDYIACSAGCGGCALSDACSTRNSLHIWQSNGAE